MSVVCHEIYSRCRVHHYGSQSFSVTYLGLLLLLNAGYIMYHAGMVLTQCNRFRHFAFTYSVYVWITGI